jgi:hypothetical protein
MGRVARYDEGQLQKPRRTAHGLRVEGYASKAGVYRYARADGSVSLELRPDDEVFSSESLASYEDAPITDGHPGKLIGGDTTLRAKLAKGIVRSARRDGDKVAIDGSLHDGAPDRSELSPGYTVRIDETAGVDPKHGRYDRIQREIRVDHLALVDRARGGRECQLRLDGEDAEIRLDAKGCFYGDAVDGCNGDCMDGDDRKDAELSGEARGNLADSRFALPEDRKLPIQDAGHVKAAMGGHGLAAVKDVSDEDKKKAARKIAAKAEKLGIDASGFRERWLGEKADEITTEKSKMAEEKTNSSTTGAESIDELRSQRDDAESRANKADAKITGLNAELLAVQAKLADEAGAAESAVVMRERKMRQDAQDELARVNSSFEERVRRAAELRFKAKSLCPDIRIDGETDDAICKSVLKRLTPTEPFEGKDAEWRRVRLDQLVEHGQKNQAQRETIARAVRTDAVDERSDNAKPKWGDVWKAGPPATTALNKKGR